MNVLRNAWAWLKSAVSTLLFMFKTAKLGRVSMPRRAPKLPLGATFTATKRGSHRISLKRQLRRQLTAFNPAMKSGRRWVRFRKNLQRGGIDLNTFARLALR